MKTQTESRPSRVNFRNLILGLTMIAVAGLAVAMKPTIRVADQGPKINLETMIPKAFGDWTLDTSIAPLQVSPDVQANLDNFYSQTLSRTYVNARGERVMLSIAYGGDQGKSMQVHKPEVCYKAQGFDVGRMVKSTVDTLLGKIPVMHLVAQQGARNEPITYWIRTGDIITRGWLEQNWARLKYGLNGTVPDGVLVRVSNISVDEDASYRLHQEFLRDMLGAVRSEDRTQLLGRFF